MRLTLCAVALCLTSVFAQAQMVRSDSLNQDPAKEKTCLDILQRPELHPELHRSSQRAPFPVLAAPVPFYIDAGHVAQERFTHPDATFIVVLTTPLPNQRGLVGPMEPGSSLVECFDFNRRGFDVQSQTIGEYWFWHLPRATDAKDAKDAAERKAKDEADTTRMQTQMQMTVPAVPGGCQPPQLLEKHDFTIFAQKPPAVGPPLS